MAASGNSSGPSRTFTYWSVPRYSSRSAPRYSAPSRSTYRSSSRTTVNNHYHGSGASSGGGFGLTNYFILNSMMDHGHDRSPVYVNTPPVITGGLVQVESGTTVVYREEERHF